MLLVSGGGTSVIALISLRPICDNIVLIYLLFDSVKSLCMLSCVSTRASTRVKCACVHFPQVAPVMPLSYKHLSESQ